MSRILSAIGSLFRRLTPARSSFGSDADRRYVQEQLREYPVERLYASPLDADLNPTGESWEQRAAYRKMVKEPAIKGPLLKKVYAVAHLTPQLLPDDPDSPADVESAAWVDWAITRSRGGWPRLIHDCAIHPLIDGFAVGEKVSCRVERGKWLGRWGLEAVKFKETRDIRYRLDQYRNVESVRNFAGAMAGREFDTDNFILLTHMALWENPFGQSDLRAAYRAYNLIEAAIKLRAILLENFSGPFLVYKYGQPARIEEARRALAAARSRGYIVIDGADELQVVNLATSAPDQFQSTIEDLRKEAATAIAGAYLQMLESKTPQGDSETHKGVSELFEWWLAASIGSALTEQLVPDLHDPHYPVHVGRPRVMLGGVDPREAEKAAGRLKTAKEIKLPVGKGQAYEILELEPPKDAADTLNWDEPGSGGMPGLPGGGGPAPGGGPGLPGNGTPPPSDNPGAPGNTPQPNGNNPAPSPGVDSSPSSLATPSPLAGKGSADIHTAPPELLAAMLELAEQGDHDGIDALAALADNPDELAEVLGEGDEPEPKAFGDDLGVGKGLFTGTIRDSIGRVRHYVNGKQVKRADAQIGEGKPHNAAPISQQAAGEFVRKALLGADKISLGQVKQVADHLKLMTVVQIRKLKAELKAAGRGVLHGPLKNEHIAALVKFAQAHKQVGAPSTTPARCGGRTTSRSSPACSSASPSSDLIPRR